MKAVFIAIIYLAIIPNAFSDESVAADRQCLLDTINRDNIADVLFIQCSSKDLDEDAYSRRKLPEGYKVQENIDLLAHKFEELESELYLIRSQVADESLKKIIDNLISRANRAAYGLRQKDPNVDAYKANTWKVTSVMNDVIVSKLPEGMPETEFIDFSERLSAACSPSNQCDGVLEQAKKIAFELDLGYSFAFTTSSEQVEQAAAYAVQMDTEWNRFLYESKTQFFFDFLAQDIASDIDPEEYRILGPPKKQWFLIHPNLTYEYLSDAPDGSQFEPGISIEVLGFNYWRAKDRFFNNSFLKNISGFGLVANYTDRAGADDWGGGIQMTLNNKYLVGVSARRGGVIGISISVNIAEIWKEKYESHWAKFSNRNF